MLPTTLFLWLTIATANSTVTKHRVCDPSRNSWNPYSGVRVFNDVMYSSRAEDDPKTEPRFSSSIVAIYCQNGEPTDATTLWSADWKKQETSAGLSSLASMQAMWNREFCLVDSQQRMRCYKAVRRRKFALRQLPIFRESQIVGGLFLKQGESADAKERTAKSHKKCKCNGNGTCDKCKLRRATPPEPTPAPTPVPTYTEQIEPCTEDESITSEMPTAVTTTTLITPTATVEPEDESNGNNNGHDLDHNEDCYDGSDEDDYSEDKEDDQDDYSYDSSEKDNTDEPPSPTSETPSPPEPLISQVPCSKADCDHKYCQLPRKIEIDIRISGAKGNLVKRSKNKSNKSRRRMVFRKKTKAGNVELDIGINAKKSSSNSEHTAAVYLPSLPLIADNIMNTWIRVAPGRAHLMVPLVHSADQLEVSSSDTKGWAMKMNANEQYDFDVESRNMVEIMFDKALARSIGTATNHTDIPEVYMASIDDFNSGASEILEELSLDRILQNVHALPPLDQMVTIITQFQQEVGSALHEKYKATKDRARKLASG